MDAKDDRLDIDVELARLLVETQFPQWAKLEIRPVEFGGWDNRTFHLGENMSVRFPSAARYAAQVEKEHCWLPLLAPHLPLTIPKPLAMGVPTDAYPYHWSVYKWVVGQVASVENIDDLSGFARTLAEFLGQLHAIDASGGPEPGIQNFYRGGSLSVYDVETRRAIETLKEHIDAREALKTWEKAIESDWCNPPVWVHGDIASGNLLVADGRLHAVIDFGCSAVGDPACDLAIAWTFFEGKSRAAFFDSLSFDASTWGRARAWALWKALISACKLANDKLMGSSSMAVIDDVTQGY